MLHSVKHTLEAGARFDRISARNGRIVKPIFISELGRFSCPMKRSARGLTLNGHVSGRKVVRGGHQVDQSLAIMMMRKMAMIARPMAKNAIVGPSITLERS